jgi:broad specificity phosphatase PhoE
VHSIVVKFVSSLEEGLSAVPSLLRSQDDIFGVVLGGGYDDQAFKKIREAAGDNDAFWLRADMTKGAPPKPGHEAEYAQDVAHRTKAKLDELRNGSDASKEEVQWF